MGSGVSRVTQVLGTPRTGHRTLTNLIQTWEPSYFRWLKDSGYYVLWLGKNDALSVDTFPLKVNEWHTDIGVEHGRNAFAYPKPVGLQFVVLLPVICAFHACQSTDRAGTVS